MMQAGGGIKVPLLAVFANSLLSFELGEEIYDLTPGWKFDRTRSACHFPGVKKVTLGCTGINTYTYFKELFPDCEEYHFPYLTEISNQDSAFNNCSVFSGNHIKEIDLPSVERLYCKNQNGEGIFYGITSPCSINLGNCSSIYNQLDNYPCVFNNSCTGVYQLKLGTLTSIANLFRTPANSTTTAGFINLVDLRVGQGTAIDLDFHNWPATNVLADSDLTNQLRSNFKNYIIDMVADMSNATAKTITLSSGVFGAVWTNAPQDYKDSLLASLTAKNWKLTNGTTTIPT